MTGLAGMSKESEMSDEQKKSSIKEFNFRKGLLVATFSGVMSASFAYGLAAGEPIKQITTRAWQRRPVAGAAGAGGRAAGRLHQRISSGASLLNIKNKTGYQYLSGTVRNGAPSRDEETIIETAIDAPSEEVVEHIPRAKPEPARVPMLSNYFFCAVAGTTWYMQFFFYTMGETQMGKYKFSSWTLHMASIIIFSTLWGIALREWKGSEPTDDRPGNARPGGAGRLHDRCRLRQLPWNLAGDAAKSRMKRDRTVYPCRDLKHQPTTST